MHRRILLGVFGLCCIVLSACFGPLPASAQQGNGAPPISNSNPNSAPQVQPQLQLPAQPQAPAATSVSTSAAPHTSDVDLTHLEVGDGKVSAAPRVGYVFSCITQFNGGGGASSNGPWFNGDGTWDATKKAVVDGSITWPSSFTAALQGDQRIFSGNDLPNHPSGVFPIASSDDAYRYDRNPNTIMAQSITLSLPANPTAAAQPNCVGGEVGMMLSGVVIFSAFDAQGHDAVAHEVQDQCNGHPQKTGFYHYHSLSDCITDNASGHSALVGYAFDGYGIYGYYGEDGKELTNADLDECHGHTHMIMWNGQMVMMYHYHATHEFPYVVGCFHGTPAVRALSAQGSQNSGQNGSQNNGQVQTQGPGQNGPGGGQPPQAAISACSGLSSGATCNFTTPNGTINGTCQTPPNLNQLVCVPQGGPPP